MHALVHPAPLAALLTVTACAAGLAPAPTNTVRARGPDGLVQHVTFARTRLARGDTLQITSTVVNTGATPITITAQLCGLGVTAPAGVLAADNGIRCIIFSTPVRLAPGDSTSGADRRAVTGPPGRYALRVRQAITPAFAAEGEIVVW